MDFGAESDWVQEDASSGTDFVSGVVKLTGYPAPPPTIVVNHTAGSVAPVTTTITYGTVITDIGGTGDKCWI
ncbi:MAG: hypothetical protein KAS86_01365, partial [Candidatus Omnitrophica bacterium]|nr:hypothetical protein [Candidatus Omnitrophota bacterium]